MADIRTAVPPTGQPSAPARLLGALLATALLAGWIGLNMGWYAAVAAVIGVFVHEYGHVLAINALGAGPGRIQIIPFIGGAATMARPPDSDFKGVLIALAGPTFGLLAAVPFYLAARSTGDPHWNGGAFFVAVISLLNLAPAPPLDGSKALGPALARIHPLVERAALVIVGAVAVFWGLKTGNYILAIFIGIATWGSFQRGPLRSPARPLSGAEWAASVALWLAALLLCGGALVAILRQGVVL